MSRAFGESDLFDTNGDLWDAQLTPKEAIRMVRLLVKAIPKLREKGGFMVEVRHRRNLNVEFQPTGASAMTSLIIDSDTKEIVGVQRMVFWRGCLNEHVVIHELAHVAADTVHGNLSDPHCGHGIGFRTWCSIIEQNWRDIKNADKENH